MQSPPFSSMQSVPFFYCAAAGAIALIAGFFLGAVLRGVKARRQIDRLTSELQRTRQELSEASGRYQAAAKPVAPVRFTGAEYAAIIGAVGTLLASFGTLLALVLNYQSSGKSLAEAKKQLTDISGIVRYDPTAWVALHPSAMPADGQVHEIDNKNYFGDCASKKVPLTYGAWNPGILHCAPGTVTVKLSKETILLFIYGEQDAFVVK
jgi:hypothetical protein